MAAHFAEPAAAPLARFLQAVHVSTASSPQEQQHDLDALQQACQRSVAALAALVQQHCQEAHTLGLLSSAPLGAHQPSAPRTTALHNQQQQQQQEYEEEACMQRQEVLDALMHRLDAAASTLHDTLEFTRETLPAPAHVPDPHEVLAYAHRLRFTTFAKMGTISLPPAPQPWQMAQSSLYRVGAMHEAQQQQQQQQDLLKQQQQQQVQVQPLAAPPPPAPAGAHQDAQQQQWGQGYVLQDGSTLAVQASARATTVQAEEQPQQPAAPMLPSAPARTAPGGVDLGLILNPDMEEVVSSSSEDDEDEDSEDDL